MPNKRPNADDRPDFCWSVRIYYEDTDAGGIVYYANYLRFFERARTEWLRALGISHSILASERDEVFVVRSLSIDYRQPARLDDLLELDLSLTQCRRASVLLHQRARRTGESTVLAEAEVRIAMIRRSSGRPVSLPQPLIASLQNRVTP